MGTRFMCADRVHDPPGREGARAQGAGTATPIVTGYSTGHPVRVLKNKLSRQLEELDRANKPEELEKLGAGKLALCMRAGRRRDGLASWPGSAPRWSTQIQPAAEIIAEIMAEAEEVLAPARRDGRASARRRPAPVRVRLPRAGLAARRGCSTPCPRPRTWTACSTPPRRSPASSCATSPRSAARRRARRHARRAAAALPRRLGVGQRAARRGPRARRGRRPLPRRVRRARDRAASSRSRRASSSSSSARASWPTVAARDPGRHGRRPRHGRARRSATLVSGIDGRVGRQRQRSGPGRPLRHARGLEAATRGAHGGRCAQARAAEGRRAVPLAADGARARRVRRASSRRPSSRRRARAGRAEHRPDARDGRRAHQGAARAADHGARSAGPRRCTRCATWASRSLVEAGPGCGAQGARAQGARASRPSAVEDAGIETIVGGGPVSVNDSKARSRSSPARRAASAPRSRSGSPPRARPSRSTTRAARPPPRRWSRDDRGGGRHGARRSARDVSDPEACDALVDDGRGRVRRGSTSS